MKKEEILKKYRQKTININGNNLSGVESIGFKSLCEHFVTDLEFNLEYLKALKKLREERKQAGKPNLGREYIAARNALIDEFNAQEGDEKFTLTPEHKKLLELLEKLYYNSLEIDFPVTKLEVVNGEVNVPKTQMYHECNLNSFEGFESYADLGIIASEWFGFLENEQEARFCAFVKNDSAKSNYRESNGSATTVKLYIDNSNPLWQQLSQLDYFEYEHLKQTAPEKIAERYPKEIIELYEQIIVPLSGGGKHMHDNPDEHFYTWQAIPGGIPPQLIVGVQINSQNAQFVERASEIQAMFPNATIFDEHRKVLTATQKPAKR